MFCLQRHRLLNESIDSEQGLDLASNLNTTLRVRAAFRKQELLEMPCGFCCWRGLGFSSYCLHSLLKHEGTSVSELFDKFFRLNQVYCDMINFLF